MLVHVDHLLQVVEALVAHVPVAVERGVVHEDVEAAEAVDGGLHAGFDRIDRRDVGGDELRGAELGECLGRVLAGVGVDLRDHHRRAFAQEALGVRVPDPATGAGDDRDLAVEPAHQTRSITTSGMSRSVRAW